MEEYYYISQIPYLTILRAIFQCSRSPSYSCLFCLKHFRLLLCEKNHIYPQPAKGIHGTIITIASECKNKHIGDLVYKLEGSCTLLCL